MSEDKNVIHQKLKSPIKCLSYDFQYFSDARVATISGPYPQSGTGKIPIIYQFNCTNFDDAKREGEQFIREHEKTFKP